VDSALEEGGARDRDGCFELLVQPQVAGKNMPVEDPTVVWSEEDSPFESFEFSPHYPRVDAPAVMRVPAAKATIRVQSER